MGAGVLGNSLVDVWAWSNSPSAALSSLSANGIGFPAFTDVSRNSPVHVAAFDRNGDGIAETILATQGPGGTTSEIRAFNITSVSPLQVSSATVVPGVYPGPSFISVVQDEFFANPADEMELFDVFAYNVAFSGGVRVATADVNGDGTADIITAAGPGGGPHVRVFDGNTGNQLAGPIGSFFAYDANFLGGVFVAAADVDGDGRADVITGAGAGGGPHVKVFSGADGSVLASFFAYNVAFSGGVQVATADVNADGTADIITAAGAGGGPHVRVFDGITGNQLAGPIGSFFAYNANFLGGVFVAAADFNGDGRADIITGAGAGGGPHVKVFSGADGSLLASFFAYDPAFSGGVRVATADVNADGTADIITAAGAGGGPHVRVFDGITGNQLAGPIGSFFAYDANFLGGVFVAAADVDGDGRADVITGPGAGGGPQVRVFTSQQSSLLAAGGAVSPTADVASLETSQLAPIVTEALTLLEAAGASITELAHVKVSVADLEGDLLGLATENAIFLDVNAAGYGWFIDPTPGLDEEYSLSDGRLLGVAPAAANHIDLLSVLLHEFGHHLGLEDVDDLSDLMGEELGIGVRRVDRARNELFASDNLMEEVGVLRQSHASR